MVAVGDADVPIAAIAAFARDHKGDDAREIRLKRHDLHVDHQLGVVFELRGNAGRALENRDLHRRVLLFRLLNAALDVADRFQVLGELRAVALAETRLEPVDIAGDVIEDAALLFQIGQARRGVSGIAITEEALEERAGVRLHRERGRPSAPGNRVGVRAAITGIAAARETGRVKAYLERGELGLFTELLCRNLIDRDSRVDARAFGFLGMHSSEPRGARPGVVARAVAERPAVDLRQAGEDVDVLAEGLERIHGALELEVAPFADRIPRGRNDA